ncbi:COG4626 Phage terminase-like protein, large subunit [uncultured Caudovirales phage]|uniref:COG4626 Phage terminase-like protein, large subunit n=1 Tax=uncultured Caudovirales phage TaxID=2100421 RepID=A0A6J5MVX8_9CAUD|nr:COG4626 Phage terminase-like protein, large subunit [uncultured Caudovirales phage]
MAARTIKSIRGQAKPRVHSPLLKGKTKGDEVIEFAKRLGQPLMPWQELIVKDFFSTDKKDKFIRRTGLLLVARQSGKSHLGRVMCLAHLFLFKSPRVLIASSNRAMALVSFREMAYMIEGQDFLNCQVKAIRYANGTESIELLPEFGGGRLDVVAATRDGSRGRTSHFTWGDELREWSDEAFTAITPTTRATDGQTFWTSNAGDAFSLPLNELKSRAMENPPKTFGYYEYSAPTFLKIDLNSKAFWEGVACANPALGITVSKEAIAESISTSSHESIMTELLCLWVSSLQSPFPPGSIEDCSDATLEMSPGAYTVFGFDVSPSKRNASLCAGQILPDGRIGVGILQTWESQVAVNDLEIAAQIKGWVDLYRPKQIMFDRYATQSIADRLSQAGCIVEDCSGQQFYQACGDLLDAVVNLRMVHNGQRSLIEQFENVAAKVNDSAWRIIKRKSAGDISAPISIAMIVTKLSKPQQVAAIYAE